MKRFCRWCTCTVQRLDRCVLRRCNAKRVDISTICANDQATVGAVHGQAVGGCGTQRDRCVCRGRTSLRHGFRVAGIYIGVVGRDITASRCSDIFSQCGTSVRNGGGGVVCALDGDRQGRPRVPRWTQGIFDLVAECFRQRLAHLQGVHRAVGVGDGVRECSVVIYQQTAIATGNGCGICGCPAITGGIDDRVTT